MKIELTTEQLQFQKEVKSFVEEAIIPYASQWDLEEELSMKIIKQLAQRKYLGAMISKKYGGMGLEHVSIGLLNEEIGRGCSSTRSLLTVHGMVALAIERWGSQKQKDNWLPKMAKGEMIAAFGLTEPQVGSDAKGIETSAVAKEDYLVLNGVKKWITMGQIADLFLIFAQYEGKPTAFLIERKCNGFSTEAIKGMLGARASMISELTFDNCKVLKENIVGKIGTGLTHIALPSLDYGRYTIAWGCVGLAQACLDESISYSCKRKQFQKSLRQHQLIQKMITEMVVEIKAARLLCLNAGYLKEKGDPESIMEIWHAKYFSSIMVNKVANDAVQIHGANGCHSKYPVERYYRDARVNEIIEGTTQMHEILIATHAMR